MFYCITIGGFGYGSLDMTVQEAVCEVLGYLLWDGWVCMAVTGKSSICSGQICPHIKNLTDDPQSSVYMICSLFLLIYLS